MKHQKLSSALPLIGVACLASFAGAFAQAPNLPIARPVAATAPTAVPALVSYSGIAFGSDGKPLAPAATSITFLIYNDPQGGEPLFTESQIVSPDSAGRYKVQLGATMPNGIPVDIFSTGAARWLEIQIAGQPPQPRVLLTSVPYALKAADAATLGGLPASAFVLAGANASISTALGTSLTPDASSTVTTTGGTANKLAKFSGSNTIVNSILYDNGTEVGIGTTSPTATLTVGGSLTVNGDTTQNSQVLFAAEGTATASTGYGSHPLKFNASAYNSSTKKVVNPRFQLQAETTGNDTSAPNATLSLLASSGTPALAETGLYFNTNGTIHFAPGQTFPDSSAAFPANSGGSAYFGGAGNSTSTGSDDTATGFHALAANTTGSFDTAVGYSAGPDPGSTGLTNATAIGANATVSQSNSLVLGKTTAGSPGASHVSVGIGTAKPRSALEAAVSAKGGLGPVLTLTNSGGNSGNSNPGAAIDFNTNLPPTSGTYNPGSRILAEDDGYFGNSLYFYTNAIGAAQDGLQLGMVIASDQRVGIAYSGYYFNGAPEPGGQLEVDGQTLSDGYGIDAIESYGANGSNGSDGGAGGRFTGGSALDTGDGGDGIEAFRGSGPGDTNLGYAGYFFGDVDIDGTLFANTKDFKIDHPLDPANKYLVHASVESSEMMNIYTGNAVTDDLGLATIKLPGWFEAENADFRYQLTTIGRDAHAWIAKKVSNGSFQIATNATNVEVSWQITAIRQDAYAKAHPIIVEQQKPTVERGFYQHPELYGQPANRQTQWGRNPQQMQRMKAMSEQQKLKNTQHATLQNSAVPAPAPGAQRKPVSQVGSK
jgi:hypothetical protein